MKIVNQEIIILIKIKNMKLKKRKNTKLIKHPTQVKRKRKKSGRKDLIKIKIENQESKKKIKK